MTVHFIGAGPGAPDVASMGVGGLAKTSDHHCPLLSVAACAYIAAICQSPAFKETP